VCVVILCFLIYLKTRESYELTKHSGIKYFRDAFLFFGLSYVARFFFSLIFLSRMAFDIHIPRNIIMPGFIFIMGYLSTIGIFYLMFGFLWKKFDNKMIIIAAHGIAALLSIIAFTTRSHLILLYLQSIFLIVAIILSIMLHKGKKITQTIMFYYLLCALWLINLWIISRIRPFSFGIDFFIDLLFEILSLILLGYIYYKISKWVK